MMSAAFVMLYNIPWYCGRRPAIEAILTSDIDNRSATALAHGWSDGLNQPEGTLHVDLDHLVEFRFIHSEGRLLSDVRSSIVHQDIHAAKLQMHSVNKPADILEPPDMAPYRQHVAAYL
jgi:hypothetical protein